MVDQEILKKIAYYRKANQFQRILNSLMYTTDPQ